MTARLTPKLYASSFFPDRWYGSDERGTLWHWPRTPSGWEQRQPHAGQPRGLEEVDPAEARGTGWPGAGVGRRRVGGSESGVPRTVRIDDTRWHAAMRAADEAGIGVSEWVREAIDLALARGSTR